MAATNVIGSDTFVRGNQSGLGTSSGGDAWTAATNNGTTTVAISSNTGVFTGVASGTGNIQLVGTKTAQNLELLMKAQFTSTSLAGFSLVLRSDGSASGDHYRCSLTTSLAINKAVSGGLTTIGSFAITPSVNTYYWIRFRVVGSSLKARVWQDGTSEPTTWGIDVTDTALTATGRYGIRGTGNNSSTTVTVASFTATDASTIVSTPVRTKVATKVTKSSVLRTVIATKNTVSSKLRTVVRTLKTV